MRSLRISLRCCGNPFTVACVLVLIVNDHLLKVHFPGWLTWKLSDCTGLFFFPFLLGLLLSVLCISLRPSPHAVAGASFACTAVWFLLAKTTPIGNQLTAELASSIAGQTTVIALDPSDALGLVVLWPAWRLWRSESLKEEEGVPPPAWPALILAASACLATSPGFGSSVVRIVVHRNRVHALVATRRSRAGPEIHEAFVTLDNGIGWRMIPGQEVARIRVPPRPAHVAHPGNPLVCWRIADWRKEVQGSVDGGRTWTTVWRIPPGREPFMARMWAGPIRPHFGCNDVALSPDGHTLFVAMGGEGVLVRDREGTWRRVAVGPTSPTPWAVRSLDESFRLLAHAEILCMLGSSLILLVVLGRKGYRRGVRAVSVTIEFLPFFALLLAFARRAGLSRSLDWAVQLLALLGMFVVFVGPLMILNFAYRWSKTINETSNPQSARRACSACLMSALSHLVVTTTPFVLWTFGIIPRYELAFGVAAGAGLICALVGGDIVKRRRREFAFGSAPGPTVTTDSGSAG